LFLILNSHSKLLSNMRNIHSVFLILFTLASSFLYAQDYNVSTIPDELKKNAFAVVRNYSQQVTVISMKSYIHEYTLAITVFDKKGDGLVEFTDYFDKSESFSSLQATIYDAQGKTTKKFKSGDFSEFSAASGFQLFNDLRVMYLRPVVSNYPYTVEYQYKKIDKDYLMLPAWLPVNMENVSVESSQYKLTIPTELTFNIKKFNLSVSPDIEEDSKNKTMVWSIRNLPPIELEPYSPSIDKVLPLLLVVPENFEYSGYSGSFSSWKDFGMWINTLNEGRDNLSAECIEKVKEMTSGMQDEKEIVKKLYNYLQKTTRYVDVSLGIGGFQPLYADDVYKYGYGDCKALSFYMKSLLKVVGIESYYTIVAAGRNKTDIDLEFPFQQFNHAILCVPISNDTLWLECTSQTNPFNYIGGFTDDRHVLLVKPEGGFLTKTKAYEMETNLQSRNVVVSFSAGTNILQARVNTKYEGLQYENVDRLSVTNAEKQKDFLLQNIDIPEFYLKTFEIKTDLNDRNPVGEIFLEMDLRNYLSLSGDRVFLPLNLMNKRTAVPKKIETRKTDVQLYFPFCDSDTIEYIIPDEYEVQFIPEKVELDYPFGNFCSTVTQVDNKIIYTRNISMRKGLFPKETYPDLINFYFEIARSDNSKALLKKKISLN
jgi:hypothetical protein